MRDWSCRWSGRRLRGWAIMIDFGAGGDGCLGTKTCVAVLRECAGTVVFAGEVTCPSTWESGIAAEQSNPIVTVVTQWKASQIFSRTVKSAARHTRQLVRCVYCCKRDEGAEREENWVHRPCREAGLETQ